MKPEKTIKKKFCLFTVMVLFSLCATITSGDSADISGPGTTTQVSPGSSSKPGVIFYKKSNYKGKSQRVTHNAGNLSLKRISSLKLDGVSSVSVFSGHNFNGNCQVFTSNKPNLAGTRIGNNTIKSVKLNGSCGTSSPAQIVPASQPGVIFYKKSNYNGKSQRITHNAGNLSLKRISSLKLDGVSSVAVFSGYNFNGNCQVFTSNKPNLIGTGIGNNTIKSAKINGNCGGIAPNQTDPASLPGVIFYKKGNYKGESQRITADVKGLDLEQISSLKLDGVSSVAVFSNFYYDGNCQVFTSDQPNLTGTGIGNNTIKSARLNGNCRCIEPYMYLFEGSNFSGRRFRLTHSAADLSQNLAGNMNNKISSIKWFNMTSVALYTDKAYRGKCLTLKPDIGECVTCGNDYGKNQISNMADTNLKDNTLSSIKFNAECSDQKPFLKVRNNAAAVVKFAWNTDDALHPSESVTLAVGKDKTFKYKKGTKIDLIVYFGYPVPDTTKNLVEFKEKCSYRIILNDNHFVAAKGTLFKGSCEDAVIPYL